MLRDILDFPGCPSLQRKGAEFTQEYTFLPAERIFHTFHEALNYQGDGLAVDPLFFGDTVNNVCFSNVTYFNSQDYLSFIVNSGQS